MSELAQTSIYLTAEDRRVAAEEMERRGLTRSALFRLALYRLHEEGQDAGARRERILAIAEELRSLA